MFGSKGGWTKRIGTERTKARRAVMKISEVLFVTGVKRTELGSGNDGDFAKTINRKEIKLVEFCSASVLRSFKR